jgi:hypothetical protein
MSIPPVTVGSSLPEIAKLIDATRMAAAASLANAIILSAHRPHSIEDATKVLEDVHHSLWSDPANPGYQAWQEQSDPKKVHV